MLKTHITIVEQPPNGPPGPEEAAQYMRFQQQLSVLADGLAEYLDYKLNSLSIEELIMYIQQAIQRRRQ